MPLSNSPLPWVRGQADALQMRGLKNAARRDDLETQGYGERQSLGLGLLRNQKAASDLEMKYAPQKLAREEQAGQLQQESRAIDFGITQLPFVKNVQDLMRLTKRLQSMGLSDETAQAILDIEPGADLEAHKKNLLTARQQYEMQLKEEERGRELEWKKKEKEFDTTQDIRRFQETYGKTGYGLPSDIKLLNEYENEPDPERKKVLWDLLQKETHIGGSGKGGPTDAQLNSLEKELREEYEKLYLDYSGKPAPGAPSVDIYVTKKMKERLDTKSKIREKAGLGSVVPSPTSRGLPQPFPSPTPRGLPQPTAPGPDAATETAGGWDGIETVPALTVVQMLRDGEIEPAEFPRIMEALAKTPEGRQRAAEIKAELQKIETGRGLAPMAR